jgi:hypothetical protein
MTYLPLFAGIVELAVESRAPCFRERSHLTPFTNSAGLFCLCFIAR